MVTTRDRGQMILIGAVAIAFILLTLVILFNGVLFTETVSNSETKDTTSQVEVVEAELKTTFERLIELELAEEGPPYSPSEIEDFEGHDSELYRSSIENSRPANVEIQEIVVEEEVPLVEYKYQSNEIVVSGSVELDIEVEDL